MTKPKTPSPVIAKLAQIPMIEVQEIKGLWYATVTAKDGYTLRVNLPIAPGGLHFFDDDNSAKPTEPYHFSLRRQVHEALN